MILVGSSLALLALAIGVGVLVGSILNERRARVAEQEYADVKLHRAMEVKRRSLG
jgi:hypothetical protein